MTWFVPLVWMVRRHSRQSQNSQVFSPSINKNRVFACYRPLTWVTYPPKHTSMSTNQPVPSSLPSPNLPRRHLHPSRRSRERSPLPPHPQNFPLHPASRRNRVPLHAGPSLTGRSGSGCVSAFLQRQIFLPNECCTPRTWKRVTGSVVCAGHNDRGDENDDGDVKSECPPTE